MPRSSLTARAVTWIVCSAAPAALLLVGLFGQAAPSGTAGTAHHAVLAASSQNAGASSPASISWP